MDNLIDYEEPLSQNQIEITNLEIENLYFDNTKRLVTLEILLGKEKLHETISVDEEAYYYNSSDTKLVGVSLSKELNGVVYSIFITSPSLSIPLIESGESTLKPINLNCAYVEVIKTYNDFTIYFIRPSLKDEYLYEIWNSQSYYYFRNTYQSIPGANNKVKKFLKIQFPNGAESIIGLKNYSVNVLPINELITIYIGKLSIGSNSGYLLLFPTHTLMYFQKSNYFVKDLRILHDNHYIPLPSLPRLLKDLTIKYNLKEQYSENVYRSDILSICFPIEKTLNNEPNLTTPEQINFQNLLVVSEFEIDPHFSNTEYLNENEESSEQIIFPGGDILSGFMEHYENNYKEISDWDERYTGSESSYFDYGSDESEWNELDFEDKLHTDAERAIDEIDSPYDPMDYLSKIDLESRSEEVDMKYYYENEKAEINYFIDNTFVISLSSNEIEFEIDQSFGSFRNQVSRIERLPFVTGIDAFTGMLKYKREFDEIFVPFAIVENINENINNQIIKDLLGYKKYRLINTKYFDIYLNTEYEKYFCFGVL